MRAPLRRAHRLVARSRFRGGPCLSRTPDSRDCRGGRGRDRAAIGIGEMHLGVPAGLREISEQLSVNTFG
jgi:hypothetical protein